MFKSEKGFLTRKMKRLQSLAAFAKSFIHVEKTSKQTKQKKQT